MSDQAHQANQANQAHQANQAANNEREKNQAKQEPQAQPSQERDKEQDEEELDEILLAPMSSSSAPQHLAQHPGDASQRGQATLSAPATEAQFRREQSLFHDKFANEKGQLPQDYNMQKNPDGSVRVQSRTQKEATDYFRDMAQQRQENGEDGFVLTDTDGNVTAQGANGKLYDAYGEPMGPDDTLPEKGIPREEARRPGEGENKDPDGNNRPQDRSNPRENAPEDKSPDPSPSPDSGLDAKQEIERPRGP